MAFPKIPNKTVTGNLRLAIRSPTIEVVAGDESVPDNGPDFSSESKFKLPKGFTMSEDPVDVVNTQHGRVANQLAELRTKRETCQACRRATSERMVDIAALTLDYVCSSLTTQGTQAVKIKFSQEKDGTLLMYFECSARTLGVRIATSVVEVGYFLENGLSVEKDYRITLYDPATHVGWLIG